MLMAQDKSADSIDPEFLTFRHNSPQAIPTSGRSIYSQRFDYKSLQKYPIFDSHNSERDDINNLTRKKIKHQVKQKNLRTVKSQEKFRQLFSPEQYQLEQNGIQDCEIDDISDYSRSFKTSAREESKRYEKNSIKAKQESSNKKKINNMPKNKTNLDHEQIVQRNIQLKSQLAKLVRNMKKEQRKQFTLTQQINDLQAGIQECDKELEEQIKNMEELNEIGNENMKECNRIIDHIEAMRMKNQQLTVSLENLEQSVDSSEISIETCKQDGLKDRMLYSQLQEGINDLIKMKMNAESNVARLEEQILGLQFQIQQMKIQEYELSKIFGFGIDSPNTSHSHNFSHSNSHSSSRTSNIANRFY